MQFFFSRFKAILKQNAFGKKLNFLKKAMQWILHYSKMERIDWQYGTDS